MYISQAGALGRLPVLVLSGFLGSGKTTLVNALLGDPRLADTAVAINEFGDVPLDHLLVDPDGDRTIVMANGCLCCNLSGDMEEAVMRLFARRANGTVSPFRRLIVEPSGLADPAPIAQAILRNPLMSRSLRLCSIIACVDALFAESQLDRHAETAKQVALADRLVVTKTDLVDEATLTRVKARIRRLNPLAPILEATLGAVDAADLLPEDFLDPTLAPGPVPIAVESDLSGAHGHHDADTVATTLLADRPLNWRAFDAWLRDIRIGQGETLLRVKGFLNLGDATGPVLIQGIHHVLHPPVELERWPGSDHRSRLVLITRGAPRGLIAAAWRDVLPGLYAVAPVSFQPEEKLFARH